MNQKVNNFRHIKVTEEVINEIEELSIQDGKVNTQLIEINMLLKAIKVLNETGLSTTTRRKHNLKLRMLGLNDEDVSTLRMYQNGEIINYNGGKSIFILKTLNNLKMLNELNVSSLLKISRMKLESKVSDNLNKLGLYDLLLIHDSINR
jgi:hypothetical protein